MNLKNSWKEIRIWFGWKQGRMTNFYFAFMIAGMVLMAISKNPTYKSNLFLGGLSLSGAFLIFWSIAICKKPRNWRLVIEDANKFQKEFGENDTVQYWMKFAKKEKNGKPLFKIIMILREIKQLEDERDKLKADHKTVPAQIIDLEMDIRNLKNEIV